MCAIPERLKDVSCIYGRYTNRHYFSLPLPDTKLKTVEHDV